MSDTSQGHGWWQASDGRWYPPETHPHYRRAAPNYAKSGRMRPFTIVILVINALFGLWVITAIATAGDCDTSDHEGACQAGVAAAVVIILFVAAVVDAILGVLWFVTRRDQR